MALYLFWSHKKEAPWELALASERHALETGGKAEFVTALDVECDFTDPNVEMDKLYYKGAFYLDFDSADIEEAIEQVQKFLGHLVEKYELDLNTVNIYASGGKGFHVVVPERVFLSKPNARGYMGLPAIYKEMAYSMFFDTMDLSVYTAKRGRMWRVTNFLRSNGKHKVPITPKEAMEMTVEYYDKVTSVPRPPIQLAPPVINNKLELLFAQAKDKVERALKKNTNRKRDANLLTKYEGKTPPTIEQLMRGEGIKEGIGFQQIATQLAITAHGLGLTRADFLVACEGLCDNHQGDGTRYGSFRLRQKELGRMFDYMAGNPTYDFSAGAIRALVDHQAVDLIVGEATDIGADGKSNLGITLGMSVDQSGIYKLTPDGFRSKVCDMGMDNFRYLQHLDTGEAIGYQADTYIDGRFIRNRRLSMDYFQSKSRFQGLTMSCAGVGCQASDAQIAALTDVIRRVTLANEESSMVYVVNHEGLDMVPVAGSPGEYDLIWVSADGVLSKRGISYTFMDAIYGSEDYPFGTDLLKAPRLLPPSGEKRDGEKYLKPQDMEQLKADLHNLFRINKPINVAKMLGWTMATFLTPLLRHRYNQFPLLHVYGSASAGKSSTTRVFAHFQFHATEPAMLSAAGSTQAPLLRRVTGTSFMAVWLDEYKPTEMLHTTLNRLREMLRGAYNGLVVERGKVSKDSGESQVVTKTGYQLAPVCYIAEALEAQKALVDRSIIVGLTEQDRNEGSAYFAQVEDPQFFGSVGRLLIDTVLFKYEPEVFYAELEKNETLIKAYLSSTQSDRPVFNLAACATGIRLLQRALAAFFGEEFNKELEDLISCLTNPSSEMVSDIAPVIKSEIIQVLSTMAFLSKCDDATDDARLVAGRDYGVLPDAVEINARRAFMKYQRHCSNHRIKPLFSSSEPFVQALRSYQGATKLASSPLGNTDVYRLDFHRVYERDDIETFGSD